MGDAPLMLSVSGVRGLVDQSLTAPVVARYAAAFGAWLRDERGAAAPLVIIGRDSRTSGKSFEQAAAAGLGAAGCGVVRLGIATTPGVAIMVKHLGADGGLVLTASHNPIEWNGIKSIRHDGAAPPADQAARIIDRFNSEDGTTAPRIERCEFDDSTPSVHRDAIVPHIDVDAIRRAGPRVVVDGVHGAGGAETAVLMDHLGVELIHLYAEPTGRFPHPPEPVAENLTELSEKVRQHGAEIGFAQDPDADRLAVVDQAGRCIGEEYTLALAVRHLLAARDTVVANLSTSRMIDDIAAEAGASVVRTPVGEANVAAGMLEHGSKIGGEGNGGVIWARVSHVRDSLVGMALILDLLARRGRTIAQIVEDIPRYAMVKEKVAIDEGLVNRIEPVLTERFSSATVDTQDGVRVDLTGRWVHVRPSNTEPIVRIFAEADNEEGARGMVQEVREALGI